MKGKILKYRVILSLVFALALVLAIAVPVLADGDTYYVATDGSDTFGDGTETWVDVDESGDWSSGDTGPWATIQRAIMQADSGDTVSVAAGTYYERINLADGVNVAGAGDDVTTINGSDSGTVVYAADVGAGTTFSGFTVTGGDTDFSGGGMLNNNSSLEVTGCTFTGNTADCGAGMYNTGSSPTVTGCTFTGNAADRYGGGMYSYDSSSPTVTNCTFTSNAATWGGGICNHNSSSPTVTGCTFTENTANYTGGGMYNNVSSPTVTGCTFTGNTAVDYGGGGMYNLSSSPALDDCDFTGNTTTSDNGGGMLNSNSSPTLTNCTFDSNTADYDGGGIYNSTSSPTLTGCTFDSNTAEDFGGGMYNYNGSSPTLDDCGFIGNTAHDEGGGMYNSLSSPALTDCTFTENTTDYDGGGMYNADSSPTLTGCDFTTNTADDRGSGMYNDESSPTLTDCTFTGNTAQDFGGGIYNYNGSSPTLTGCAFTTNTALYGGGMLNDASSPTLTGCTFTGNDATDFGGGICNSGSSPTLTNCTFDSNTAGTGGGMHVSSGSPAVNYCNFTGNSPSGISANNGTNVDATNNWWGAASGPAHADNTYIAPGEAAQGDAVTDYVTYLPWLDAPFDADPAGESFVPVITDEEPAGQYASIQGAIDGVTGTTITCAAGTYYEDITLADGVNVAGAGDDVTTIQGTGSGTVVTADSIGAGTTFSGFTVTGGDEEIGGGMYILNSSLTVSNCTFTGNTALDGGGMTNESSSSTVTGCTFTGNTAGELGAGMCNFQSSPTVTGCTFDSNACDKYGGGMANYDSSSPTVTDCTFIDNTAGYDGGGMFNWVNCSPQVTGCDFTTNSAGDGGGMFNDENSSPTVTDCTFTGNRATDNGGGVANSNSSSPEVTGCTFDSNMADDNGGGMANSNSSSPTVTDSTFDNNTTGGVGDGIYADGGSSTDAEHNWWGHASGPYQATTNTDGQGDEVTDNVLYDPWWADAAMTTEGTNYVIHNQTQDIYYTTIQGAIDAANPGDTIGVPAGTYYENITLADGVNVAGAGDDVTTIQGTGGGTVVTANGIGAGTTFSGFTVTGGEAYSGGGMYNNNSSLTVTDCTFDSNTADYAGGGMYNYNNSSPTVTGCTFTDNTVNNYGGGMYNTGSSPTVTDCTFDDNAAQYGGGMYNDNSSPEVTGCAFIGNTATNGGGMFNNNYSSPTVSDGTFDVNTANNYGGGMYNSCNSSPAINNSTFTENMANYGGGMADYNSSSPAVTGCTFTGNEASSGGGMYNYDNSSPIVTDSTFTENTAEYGGGMYNETSSPEVTGGTFDINTADDSGGGMYNYQSSPTLTGSTFDTNMAIYGGGIYNYDASSPALTNCTFTGNEAGFGGGLYNESSSPTVHYCDFLGNPADETGGIYADGDSNVNATNNWWGTASGPTHEDNTYLAPGETPQGDSVSNNVTYLPWLDAPYDTGASFVPVTTDEEPAGQYASIQGAIDGVTGTTITCAAGTYNESLNITNKSLNLVSADGAGQTFIEDFVSEDTCIAIHLDGGQTVLLEGFTVTYGQNLIYLSVDNDSHVTIRDNILMDCWGGVYSESTTLDNGSSVTVEGNEIYGSAGAIMFQAVSDDSQLDITGNNLHDNDYGVFITSIEESRVNINNGNNIYDNDYGVYVENIANESQVNITNGNTIYSNVYYGVAVESLYVFGQLDVTGNTFYSNGVGEDGSAVEVWNVITGSQVSISNNTVHDNDYGLCVTAVDSTDADSRVDITGNTIYSNNCDGVYVGNVVCGGLLNIDNGNNIYLNDYGVYVEYVNASQVDIAGNAVYSNTHTGIYAPDIENGSQLNITNGNDIHNNDFGVRVVNVTGASQMTITGNDIHANDYGIMVAEVSDDSTASVNGNNIEGNTSLGLGYFPELSANIDATNNWWGSASGPAHEDNTYFAPGEDTQGDAIQSDMTDYVPWLDAPFDGDPAGESFVPVTTTTDEVLVGQYSSVQAAIDEVGEGVAGGSTITCAPGAYQESLEIINKSLNLVSQAGAAQTVINDNSNTHVAIHLDGGQTVLLEGFTVTYGEYLVALSVDNDSHVTIRNNILWDCYAGVYSEEETLDNGSSVTIEGNEFSYGYGAIGFEAVSNNSQLDIIGNNIHDNEFGICVGSVVSSQLNITNGNTICDSTNSGVAVNDVYANGQMNVTGNTVYGNGIGEDYAGVEVRNVYDGGQVSVTGNDIYENEYGVGVYRVDSTDADSRVDIADNTIYSNVYEGVYVDQVTSGGQLSITGNAMYANNTGVYTWRVASGGQLDIAGNDVYDNDYGVTVSEVSDDSTARVHFNNIMGNTNWGLHYEPEHSANIDATNNWWGDETGPTHEDNPDGTGDLIIDNVDHSVDYDPWLNVRVTGAVLGTCNGDGTVDGQTRVGVTVDQTGTGTTSITLAQYEDNPGTGFTGDTGTYVDVNLDTSTDVDEIVIKVYYTNDDIIGVSENTLTLRWWDGANWIDCSDTGVDITDIPGPPAYSGYIWARIRVDTVPSLDQLTGSVFAGVGVVPSGGGGGGGGGGALSPGTTSVTGYVGVGGRFITTIIASSLDNICSIVIYKDTIGLGPDLYPLTVLIIEEAEDVPPPPAGAQIIALAYDFGPDGSTFDPSALLKWHYGRLVLPEGIGEDDLVIAYYDGMWHLLETTINSLTRTAMAELPHFTTFALLGMSEPAAFNVGALNISPAEVAPGEEVSISVLVTNTGSSEGTYSAVLRIDGVHESTKGVTLAAGESRRLNFTVTRSEIGSYDVTVAGFAGSFTVAGPVEPTTEPPDEPEGTTPPAETEPPAATEPSGETPTGTAAPTTPAVTAGETNWVVVGGVIGGVVVIIVLVIVLVAVRRRG